MWERRSRSATHTATEALCNYLDFIWVDMEHVPFSLETVQAHMMATKGRMSLRLCASRGTTPS